MKSSNAFDHRTADNPDGTHSVNGPAKCPACSLLRRKPKPSGKSIPESQRSTERVTLRLKPDTARKLEAIARAYGSTLSSVVANFVEDEHWTLRKQGTVD